MCCWLKGVLPISGTHQLSPTDANCPWSTNRIPQLKSKRVTHQIGVHKNLIWKSFIFWRNYQIFVHITKLSNPSPLVSHSVIRLTTPSLLTAWRHLWMSPGEKILFVDFYMIFIVSTMHLLVKIQKSSTYFQSVWSITQMFFFPNS